MRAREHEGSHRHSLHEVVRSDAHSRPTLQGATAQNVSCGVRRDTHKMAKAETMPSLVKAALLADDDSATRTWLLPSMTTTLQERARFSRFVEAEKWSSRLDIEWVVDVADNNLNWFIATAYVYDDEARTIRVAIPDRDEPQ